MGSKRARQYEHIKESEKQEGRSEGRAEEIAARSVNKDRAQSGEAQQASKLSREDIRPAAAAASGRVPDRAVARAPSSMRTPSASVSRAARA